VAGRVNAVDLQPCSALQAKERKTIASVKGTAGKENNEGEEKEATAGKRWRSKRWKHR
jgi:hypothetical protein